MSSMVVFQYRLIPMRALSQLVSVVHRHKSMHGDETVV